MMHYSTHKNAGFTAVELLITLFVAAAFLTAGYQLFSLIMKDGGDTRAESIVNNEAYNYLRQYSNTPSNPCVASTPVTNSGITIENVASPRLTVTITCPQSSTTSLSRVEVSITYGLGVDAKTLKHATYVDKSKGGI